jgi:hypothetical protein
MEMDATETKVGLICAATKVGAKAKVRPNKTLVRPMGFRKRFTASHDAAVQIIDTSIVRGHQHGLSASGAQLDASLLNRIAVRGKM